MPAARFVIVLPDWPLLQEIVYVPLPPDGLTVAEPFAKLQPAAEEVAFATTAGSAVTCAVLMPEHPLASEMVTV